MIDKIVEYAYQIKYTRSTDILEFKLRFFSYKRRGFLGVDYSNKLIILRNNQIITEILNKKYGLLVQQYPYLDESIWISVSISDQIPLNEYLTCIDSSYNLVKYFLSKIKN